MRCSSILVVLSLLLAACGYVYYPPEAPFQPQTIPAPAPVSQPASVGRQTAALRNGRLTGFRVKPRDLHFSYISDDVKCHSPTGEWRVHVQADYPRSVPVDYKLYIDESGTKGHFTNSYSDGYCLYNEYGNIIMRGGDFRLLGKVTFQLEAEKTELSAHRVKGL
jgi:hypothetical protein